CPTLSLQRSEFICRLSERPPQWETPDRIIIWPYSMPGSCSIVTYFVISGLVRSLVGSGCP
ncbi:hypothetical protein P3646_24015, partial [Vibrio parahaemolyticus]|nr:hypothetical protein [Vibrio parahaemolyticus]